MQRAIGWGQAFDSPDLGAIGLDRVHDARSHTRAVEQHGTGAAHPVLAADVGAAQAQVLTQKIDQRLAHFDFARVSHSIDCDRHGRATHQHPP